MPPDVLDYAKMPKHGEHRQHLTLDTRAFPSIRDVNIVDNTSLIKRAWHQEAG